MGHWLQRPLGIRVFRSACSCSERRIDCHSGSCVVFRQLHRCQRRVPPGSGERAWKFVVGERSATGRAADPDSCSCADAPVLGISYVPTYSASTHLSDHRARYSGASRTVLLQGEKQPDGYWSRSFCDRCGSDGHHRIELLTQLSSFSTLSTERWL